MPRIQINFPLDPTLTRRADDSTDASDKAVPTGEHQPWIEPVLNVNWLSSPIDGTGHVQISLEVSRAYLETALGSMNGNRPDTSLLWSDVLSRVECNKLIKAIRSGRDGAYGKDD